jgi:hypothetical protein
LKTCLSILNPKSSIEVRRGQAMRNMLALFAAALLTVIGLGWYLGWYKVSSQPASVPGQHSVQIDIDTHKIGDDLEKGEKKVEKFIKEKKDEARKLPEGKNNDSLMLPTGPKSSQLNVQTENGSSLQLNKGDNGPLFQFQTSKGQSLQVGGGDKGPMIQFGSEKGGPFIQIGGGDKK